MAISWSYVRQTFLSALLSARLSAWLSARLSAQLSAQLSTRFLMLPNLTNHYIKLSDGDLQCEWNSDVNHLGFIFDIFSFENILGTKRWFIHLDHKKCFDTSHFVNNQHQFKKSVIYRNKYKLLLNLPLSVFWVMFQLKAINLFQGWVLRTLSSCR